MTDNWITPNSKMGLVSVVIPTYNRESLLEEAIQSVFEQTYRPIECIIVDDGSTDGTKIMVHKFAGEFSHTNFTLKYIYQPNAGAQVARNTGTIASTGEYIQYLDSDDLLCSGKICDQVKYFNENKSCDGVFGDWRTGDRFNNTVVTAFAKQDMLDQILTERCIHTLSFLMRRELIASIGPWDTLLKRNQEIDYHLRGLLMNANYHYCPTETGLHRTHDGEQITTTTGTSEIMEFYQKWEKLLEKHGKFTEEMKVKFANLYVWYFLQDIKRGRASLQLLNDTLRFNPNHSLFSSKKLQFLKKCIGTRASLSLWLNWFIFLRKRRLSK